MLHGFLATIVDFLNNRSLVLFSLACNLNAYVWIHLKIYNKMYNIDSKKKKVHNIISIYIYIYNLNTIDIYFYILLTLYKIL